MVLAIAEELFIVTVKGSAPSRFTSRSSDSPPSSTYLPVRLSSPSQQVNSPVSPTPCRFTAA